MLRRIGVGALTLRRKFLLAVHAIAACDLETGDDAIAFLQVLDLGTELVDFTAELVAEDVAFLELDDGAVEEVQVATADGGAGDFEDDVAGLDEAWFGDFDCDVKGARVSQSSHSEHGGNG